MEDEAHEKIVWRMLIDLGCFHKQGSNVVGVERSVMNDCGMAKIEGRMVGLEEVSRIRGYGFARGTILSYLLEKCGLGHTWTWALVHPFQASSFITTVPVSHISVIQIKVWSFT